MRTKLGLLDVGSTWFPFPEVAANILTYLLLERNRSGKLNFRFTEFSEVGWVLVCAAFLLQHLLAGASDLHSDEPKGGYGLLSLVSYAPKVFLVRPRAPVPFQPLVHLEDTSKHCLCPVLQLEQRCVRPAQQEYPLVAYLAWPLAFSF
jgi:hypothetical protein